MKWCEAWCIGALCWIYGEERCFPGTLGLVSWADANVTYSGSVELSTRGSPDGKGGGQCHRILGVNARCCCRNSLRLKAERKPHLALGAFNSDVTLAGNPNSPFSYHGACSLPAFSFKCAVFHFVLLSSKMGKGTRTRAAWSCIESEREGVIYGWHLDSRCGNWVPKRKWVNNSCLVNGLDRRRSFQLKKWSSLP